MVDLIMPEIDGIEVCRRIKKRARRGALHPGVMLTSRETKDDMTRGLEAGADDFVGKSGDMTVLKARIRALLRRKFFQEENRRIREQLMRTQLEATRRGPPRNFLRPGRAWWTNWSERTGSWRRSAIRSRTICALRCGASMVQRCAA